MLELHPSTTCLNGVPTLIFGEDQKVEPDGKHIVRVGFNVHVQGELGIIVISEVYLRVPDLLPQHRQRYEGNVDGEAPRFQALGVRVDILLNGLDGLLEVAIVKVLVPKS